MHTGKQGLVKVIRKVIRIFGKEDISWKNNQASNQDGLLPRCLRYLWQSFSTKKVSFNIKISFFEIYNDQVYDLLSSKREILNIHHSKEVLLIGIFCRKPYLCKLHRYI